MGTRSRRHLEKNSDQPDPTFVHQRKNVDPRTDRRAVADRPRVGHSWLIGPGNCPQSSITYGLVMGRGPTLYLGTPTNCNPSRDLCYGAPCQLAGPSKEALLDLGGLRDS